MTNLNPFLAESYVQRPLDHDLCQQIHARALQLAAREVRAEAVPTHLNIAALKRQVKHCGPDAYLLHPEEIKTLFAEVNVTILRVVKRLYCSRLGRSIHIVWRILREMALEAKKAVLPYETVWALCLYFEEVRQTSLHIRVERSHDQWWVGSIPTNFSVQTRTSIWDRPVLVCCIETGANRVLAFRVTASTSVEETVSSVIYDALISSRRPHARSKTGLLWHLPRVIVTEASLPQECNNACTRVGVKTEVAVHALPLVHSMQETWARELSGQTLHIARCVLLFDTYLAKSYHYGPLREQRQREHEYARLVGYGQDPAWQFPLLRVFLPSCMSEITSDGVIAYNGLHYSHEFLSYWRGHSVVLRCPFETEAMIWVYLDGDILCQAYARELRRHDGTYRSVRPER